VTVGPRQLAQHKAIKPIGLPARSAEPVPRRLDLVGMQRQHLHPRVQQPLDQHAVRALDRDDLHLKAHQRIAQRGDPALVVRKRLTEQRVAGVIGDQDVVLLRRPDDPSAITHRSSFGTVRQRPDLEVPLRVLIDKALNG
jgi:hypothetical protein